MELKVTEYIKRIYGVDLNEYFKNIDETELEEYLETAVDEIGLKEYLEDIDDIGIKEYLDNVEYDFELKEYLCSMSGKDLYKKDQEEIINKIGLRDSFGELLCTVSILNSYINNLGMQLISNRVSRYGKTIVWERSYRQ